MPDMLRLLPVLLLFSVGCATYEYDITRPENLAMHVGRKGDAVATWAPVEYRLRAVENRLVMSIYNRTDDSMQLVGERSSVVDPDGQSHPLRNQAIAPQSFAKLILPPYRPRLYHSGPTFGIGVGTHVGDRRGYGYDEFDQPYFEEPIYLDVVDDSALFWEWSGEGQIRMSLVFTRKDETFTQEFVIRRVKV